ncbi:MAG: 23S rRNA (pseudouridine(1915)-N(3))-methyltransferase RlmH [bacterium]|nr:23S rRNA (pseudouridine(1915)-N(3))-methyltransferase RlmH [bacterium]
MRVLLYYVGKPRDRYANAMAEEFVKRASRWARVEMREIQPRRPDPFATHPGARTIALDPAGRACTSARFIEMVRRAESAALDLVFLVGGADGLPSGWRERAGELVCLSKMTFPHELARVMLAEQIYRAFASLRGHPYPR